VLRQAVLEGVDSGELRCPNVEVAMLCLRGILNHATGVDPESRRRRAA
jgi:hypothetical protein